MIDLSLVAWFQRWMIRTRQDLGQLPASGDSSQLDPPLPEPPRLARS